MKLKRKSIVISSFILLDCIFAGMIVSGKVMGKTVNAVAHINATDNTSFIEKMSTIDEEVIDDIGDDTLSQEDLLIAQEIIMNEQNNSVELTNMTAPLLNPNLSADKLTSSINTNISNSNAAKKRREQQQRELEASIAKNAGTATGKAISQYAVKFNGKRYVFGGTWNGELPYTPTDCSGFMQGLYAHFGIKIPRTARLQAQVGVEVNIKNIQPGDLVFYSDGGPAITHVAMYIGNGKIIHARTPALGIGINSVFIMKRITIRRIITK